MTELNDRLRDLLERRATEGLSETELAELKQRLNESGLDDLLADDLVAAAASNAFALDQAADEQAAPAALKARLLDDAEQFFGASAPHRAGSGQRRFRDWGWALAAALAVLAIAIGWHGDATVDPEAARSELLAQDGTQRIEWTTPDAEGFEAVTGDVVWNDAEQAGYLLLANMPVNDPQVSQYQLWIVDPDRDSHPVDGGVFDVSDATTVIIPIDSKLKVSEPTVFAITREQPGGVVVSDGPLLVVAAAG